MTEINPPVQDSDIDIARLQAELAAIKATLALRDMAIKKHETEAADLRNQLHQANRTIQAQRNVLLQEIERAACYDIRVTTLKSDLSTPEQIRKADADLGARLRDGWDILSLDLLPGDRVEQLIRLVKKPRSGTTPAPQQTGILKSRLGDGSTRRIPHLQQNRTPDEGLFRAVKAGAAAAQERYDSNLRHFNRVVGSGLGSVPQ